MLQQLEQKRQLFSPRNRAGFPSPRRQGEQRFQESARFQKVLRHKQIQGTIHTNIVNQKPVLPKLFTENSPKNSNLLSPVNNQQFHRHSHSMVMNEKHTRAGILSNRGSSLSINTPEKQWESQQFPLRPGQVLKDFAQKLTSYEQSEILSYKKIFTIGIFARKVTPHLKQANSGFDSKKGDYKVVMRDHLAYQYEIMSVLGKGSFGIVCKCWDYKHSTFKAVKIIRNKPKFMNQGKIEVKLLKTLKKSKNNCIVKVYDSFVFRNHLCIVFELLHINLYQMIRHNSHNGVSLNIIKQFALQIFTACKITHDNNIIHCDLKPENIMLLKNQNHKIKIIDYGTSCYSDQILYSYIQSRYYRAPEIMLGISYTSAIDIWSIGCILYELYTGQPLFACENEPQQIAQMVQILGFPPSTLLEQATRGDVFFDDNQQLKLNVNQKGQIIQPGSLTFIQLTKCHDLSFIDLLNCNFNAECFIWSPQDRITATRALQHQFLKQEESSPVRVDQRPKFQLKRIHKV